MRNRPCERCELLRSEVVSAVQFSNGMSVSSWQLVLDDDLDFGPLCSPYIEDGGGLSPA